MLKKYEKNKMEKEEKQKLSQKVYEGTIDVTYDDNMQQKDFNVDD